MRECVCQTWVGEGVTKDGWRDGTWAVPRDQSKWWEVPSGTCWPGCFLLEPTAPTLGLPESWEGALGSMGEQECYKMFSGSSPVQQTVKWF